MGVGTDYGTSVPYEGNWLAVLEKGWGTYLYNQVLFTRHEPYDFINQGRILSAGVDALTPGGNDADYLSLTALDTTRAKLESALNGNNHKVVTASIQSYGKRTSEKNGLVVGHGYSVLAFDPNRDGGGWVLLRNPHQNMPVLNLKGDPTYWRGKEDFPGLPNGGDGRFWLTLENFDKFFSQVCYEE